MGVVRSLAFALRDFDAFDAITSSILTVLGLESFGKVEEHKKSGEPSGS